MASEYTSKMSNEDLSRVLPFVEHIVRYVADVRIVDLGLMRKAIQIKV